MLYFMLVKSTIQKGNNFSKRKAYDDNFGKVRKSNIEREGTRELK